MKIGNFYFVHSPKMEYQFVSVEFNPETVDKCTKKLNELIKNGWDIQFRFQTDSGIVVELVRDLKK